MKKNCPISPIGTFVFTPELGRRLMELRNKAGLTQAQLAKQMGRIGKGGHFLVGRLERASVKRPSLRLISDYLRACRAGFSDIADVLDEYTRLPRVADEQGRAAVQALVENLPQKTGQAVSRYDAKTSVDRRLKGQLPEPPDKRLRRAQRLAASLLVRQRLEDELHIVLNRLGKPGMGFERKALADYGRRAWGILARTRGKEDERDRALRELADWAAKEKVLVTVELEQIAARVKELFRILEQKGDLDRLPTALKAEQLARTKVVTDEQQCRKKIQAESGRRQMERHEFLQRVRDETGALLAELGVPEQERAGYLTAVPQYYHIATHSAAGSDQRRKMEDDFLADIRRRNCNPKIARRLGRLTLERYEQTFPACDAPAETFAMLDADTGSPPPGGR